METRTQTVKQEFWPTIIETIYPPRVRTTIDGVPVGYRIGYHGAYSSAKVVTTPKDFPEFTKKLNDWFAEKNGVPAVQIFDKTIKTTTLKRSGWLPSTISNAGLYQMVERMPPPKGGGEIISLGVLVFF